MKAMILAAGRGTRMAPLTDDCPKPLLPLAGKPLIVHHIEKLVAAGFDQIVINHAYLGEMIEQMLGDGSQYQCRIQYSAESEALETAGGIINALPLLGQEPFLLINGDVWTSWNYARAAVLIEELKQAPDLQGHLWLVDNPSHNPGGDFALTNNKRLSADVSEGGFTFSGISVLSPVLFSGLSAGVRPLAPLLREAMGMERLTGEMLNSHWVDVGTPQRLARLEQQLLNHEPAKPVGAGDTSGKTA